MPLLVKPGSWHDSGIHRLGRLALGYRLLSASIGFLLLVGFAGSGSSLAAGGIKFTKRGFVKVEVTRGVARVKSKMDARALLSFPPLPALSPSHRCVRLDVYTIPGTGRHGVVFATKGPCSGATARAPKDWPVLAVFRVNSVFANQMAKTCRMMLQGRDRSALLYERVYVSLLELRYCYLDMKPKVTRIPGGTRRSWHTNCGKAKNTRRIKKIIRVPVTVSCIRKH